MAFAKRVVFLWASKRTLDLLMRVFPHPMGVLSRVDEEQCSLERSDFLGMELTEVYAWIEVLIEQLVTLMHVYQPGGIFELKLSGATDIRENGSSVATSNPFSVTIVRDAKELASAHPDHGTYCGALLNAAQSDDDVAHALRLLRDPKPSWASVYDVYEFLKGKVSLQGLDRHRQTANSYRHLGNPKNNPPPQNPPTLFDSQQEIYGLLRGWLESRMK